MSNYFDFRCPACGDEDHIDIAAIIWIRATEDGTDPDLLHDGNHDYTPDSAAHCSKCRHFGTLREFTPGTDEKTMTKSVQHQQVL